MFAPSKEGALLCEGLRKVESYRRKVPFDFEASVNFVRRSLPRGLRSPPFATVFEIRPRLPSGAPMPAADRCWARQSCSAAVATSWATAQRPAKRRGGGQGTSGCVSRRRPGEWKGETCHEFSPSSSAQAARGRL